MSTPNQNQPGLVASHAQYVKGAAEVRTCPPTYHITSPIHKSPFYFQNHIDSCYNQETIGNVTGSQAWQASGAQDKTQAVDAMKAASANRDPNEKGFGGIEQKAGSLVGCEGMEKEGAESKKQ